MFKVGDKVKIVDREAFIDNVSPPDNVDDDAFWDELEEYDFSSMVGTVTEILNDPYWEYVVSFKDGKYPILAGWFSAKELAAA
jgi:hypothetical protein